jgi:hypothetical protein
MEQQAEYTVHTIHQLFNFLQLRLWVVTKLWSTRGHEIVILV